MKHPGSDAPAAPEQNQSLFLIRHPKGIFLSALLYMENNNYSTTRQIMKKILFAAAAVLVAAGLTNCQKEDKTPTDVKDAKVVSTVTPGETIDETVGDVVEVADQNGQVVADGEGVATEDVVVNSDGSVPAPAVADTPTK